MGKRRTNPTQNTIAVRLGPGERELLEEAARMDCLSLSELLRELIGSAVRARLTEKAEAALAAPAPAVQRVEPCDAAT